MIHDFNSDEFEDSVDQYEFAIASLLLLGKITKDDLGPIMDKFRALAGPRGVIDVVDGATIEEDEEVLEKLKERAKSRRFNEGEIESKDAEEDEQSKPPLSEA